MKLLFDENLSPALVAPLADGFPGSAHVREVGLRGAADRQIWEYAKREDFLVVTKDDDFREISLLRGAPPKLVMINIGNCTTVQIQSALLRHAGTLESFAADPATSLLVLERT